MKDIIEQPKEGFFRDDNRIDKETENSNKRILRSIPLARLSLAGCSSAGPASFSPNTIKISKQNKE